MAWQEWVQVLGTGAFGAVLGLIGVFLAFRLTARRDERVTREVRTSESVAAVVVAASSLARRLATLQHLWLEAAVVDFVAVCQMFATRESREHRDVSGWVLVRCEALTAILAERPSRFAPLWLRQGAMRRIAHHMGETAGVLVEWNAGLRTTRWFVEHRDGTVQ